LVVPAICLALVTALAAVFAAVSFGLDDDLDRDSEGERAQKQFLTEDQCYVCHLDDEYLPEHFNDDDVHIQPGLSCAGCHGGDPTSDDPDRAMSEDAGFLGVPSKSEIPEFCGRCHSDIGFMRRFQPRIATDQVLQYLTSQHGQLLVAGDRKVADCTSCHSVHAILPASDGRSTVYPLNVPSTCNNCHGDSDYMSGYSIGTDQFDQYAKSVHGVALLEKEDTGAPACNDCHGNHGALPPEVESIAQVCGQCHVNNMQYFEASTMAEAFAEEDLVGCEECHGNHEVQRTNDEMVGVGDNSVCVDCHAEGDEGYAAAQEIYGQITGLSTIYMTALENQKDVQHKGMDDVEIEFLLQEAHQSLVQARTLVHTFDPGEIEPKTGEGTKKVEEALSLAEESIKEFYFRRRGFGLATIFITLLVVALIFKVRHMERN
jgi:predicted CXXCH cytochrome family protein